MTIASGGVLPKIHPELLARKRGSSAVIAVNQQDHVPSPTQRKTPAAKKKIPIKKPAPKARSKATASKAAIAAKATAAASKSLKVCDLFGHIIVVTTDNEYSSSETFFYGHLSRFLLLHDLKCSVGGWVK